MLRKVFEAIRRHRVFALTGLAGAVLGVIGWGAFNTAMDASNLLSFCISCHEMRNHAFEEYKKTIHYSNPSGVRAICSDCHVPKQWGHKVVRKIQATNELWHKITGSIDTPEKYEAARLAMARRVWDDMKRTDSRECRNCHSYDAMDFAHQKPKAAEQMAKGRKEGQTCIDCHKGVAHKMPDMTTGYKAMFDQLAAAGAALSPKPGDRLFTLATKNLWLARPSAESATADGRLLAASEVEVLARDGDWLQARIAGWQQEGAERVLYAMQGKRILVAALGSDAVEKVARGRAMTDPDTDQKWTEGALTFWTTRAGLTVDRASLDAYGAEMFNASCGLCHAPTPTGHYLANQWIGVLNAMKRFISLDDEQYRFLQKWVQMRAQDTGGAH
ncbi:MAG: NapC/NirT family cytochrome c [Methylobacteriaceae bacterium]|nr:NapC/NirT family cytochrome c [Methylobacteriaceae bacterium]